MARRADDLNRFASRLAEPFEERNVSTSVLEAMGRLEASVSHRVFPEFTDRGHDEVFRLRGLRELGLRCAHDFLSRHFSASESNLAVLVLFQVARILNEDKRWFLALTPSNASVSLVLSRASAAVLVALRLESSSFKHRLVLEALAVQATAFGAVHGGDEVSVRAIIKDQYQLLESLSWSPSAGTWLDVYLARLDACFNLIDANLGDRMVQARDKAVHLAFHSIAASPFHGEIPPRQIATGCLSLALLSTGFVAPQIFAQAGPVTPDRDQFQLALICVVFDQPIKDIEACIVSVSTVLNRLPTNGQR